MKYKSELIEEIVDKRGHVKSSLHYQSECIEQWIEENKGAYPKLCDYQSEWLYYINENPIGEFPYLTLTDITEATVNNVVPYAYKSAILKGRTLVNLVPQNSGSFNGTRFLRIPLSYTLKSNTNYFVNFIVKESTLTDGVTCRFKNTSTGITMGALKSSGIIAVNTNAPDILEIYINNTDDVTNGLDAIIDDIMVIEYQEGMENWNIPCFEGMQSVKMPVLTTTGKNTLNPNEITFDSNSGTNPESYTYSEGVYTFKNSRSNNQMRFLIAKQNASDKILNEVLEVKDLNGNVIPYKLEMEGSNDKNYWFSIIRPDWGNVGEVKIKLGVDSLEPYKSNILTVNEDVTLRSNGNICDELNLLTGQLTQRIGEDGEVLPQEVVKTVDLTIEDNDGNTLSKIKPIEGTMHLSTDGETIKPTFTGEIPIEAITQNLASFIEE